MVLFGLYLNYVFIIGRQWGAMETRYVLKVSRPKTFTFFCVVFLCAIKKYDFNIVRNFIEFNFLTGRAWKVSFSRSQVLFEVLRADIYITKAQFSISQMDQKQKHCLGFWTVSPVASLKKVKLKGKVCLLSPWLQLLVKK